MLENTKGQSKMDNPEKLSKRRKTKGKTQQTRFTF